MPQYGDENEDGCDEDDGQGNLADGSTRERLDLTLRAFAILFLVPAGKSCKEEKADEGENNGDDSEECVLARRKVCP